MYIFSQICNICCKYDATNLQNICEGNMNHLKDTLITFIGHTDVINNNTIYLCQLCCEELIRCNKFKGMCIRNVIQLRQLYLNATSNFTSEETRCTVQNALEKLLHEEVLRNKSVEDCNSKNLQEIITRFLDIDKNDAVVEKELVNLQAERSAFRFGNDCEKPEVEFVKVKMEFNETALGTSGEMNLEVIERKYGEDTSFVLDPQTEFVKQQLRIENKPENSASQGLQCVKINNETIDLSALNSSNERDNLQMEFTERKLYIKEEYCDSNELQLEQVENGSCNNAFQVTNIRSEENADDGVNIRSRRSNRYCKLSNEVKKTTLKRKFISLEQKIWILDRLKVGEGSSAIAKSLHLNEATVRTIKKNEEKIRASVLAGSALSAKKVARTRDIKIERMEKSLIIWIQDCIKKQMPLDGNLIKQTALEIYKHVKETAESSSKQKSIHEFSASKGWFEKFKKRFSLHNIKLQGENA